MIPRALQHDNLAKWTFCLSLTIHLLTLLVFNSAHLFRPVLHESTPYYVDIVSLPSVDPAPAGSESPTAPSPLPTVAKQPLPAQKSSLSLPAKQPPAAKPAVSSPVADQAAREQEVREFTERMNRLERTSDERHQADALAALQKKAAEKKVAGGSSLPGSNKGSDYGAYIQSRLKDSLEGTIVFRGQKPEAAVHLYIDKTGKLIRFVMIRPSSDKLFNDSVIRAIEKAKAAFPPVPSGAGFDKLYVFSPEEVKK
jgi:colicin import membrane protein